MIELLPASGRPCPVDPRTVLAKVAADERHAKDLRKTPSKARLPKHQFIVATRVARWPKAELLKSSTSRKSVPSLVAVSKLKAGRNIKDEGIGKDDLRPREQSRGQKSNNRRIAGRNERTSHATSSDLRGQFGTLEHAEWNPIKARAQSGNTHWVNGPLDVRGSRPGLLGGRAGEKGKPRTDRLRFAMALNDIKANNTIRYYAGARNKCIQHISRGGSYRRYYAIIGKRSASTEERLRNNSRVHRLRGIHNTSTAKSENAAVCPGTCASMLRLFIFVASFRRLRYRICADEQRKYRIDGAPTDNVISDLVASNLRPSRCPKAGQEVPKKRSHQSDKSKTDGLTRSSRNGVNHFIAGRGLITIYVINVMVVSGTDSLECSLRQWIRNPVKPNRSLPVLMMESDGWQESPIHSGLAWRAQGPNSSHRQIVEGYEIRGLDHLSPPRWPNAVRELPLTLSRLRLQHPEPTA
ncbi:hypothetical protein EVAR_998_1 [Eumeta japonica]|uniref:Uncharacterized protein n=1 Tax=Eumeta variegata TaxID=151549 RepID=A0A4C1SE76_EUMVA|nr:hypothetical protein EVAR_998_1 [Eumeta japonica]